MSATIFPVGHYTGLRSSDDGPAHTVRIGWRQHRLDENAFGTWVLAHGLPANGKAAWAEADLRAQAGDSLDVTAALRKLAGEDLITTVDGDAETFARTHRLGIYFVGLGNSPQEPDQFAIGLPGLGTAATVDSDSYELWQWGSIAPTLWHSCELRASVTSRDDRTVSAHDAAGEILGDLRLLVASGCAYLDAVVSD
ncbi:hypothetical protein [Kribbella sp. CA-293567]|uniref:hypothetical protein n=1 Tax=Kribbella sp. CA-293567 TaxID=3002436 RepID=UPI0022DD6043|nr:hypothetical protein [Kribbella sp. CA-293567]WBQ08428.1 hypothetical protein OX958_16805 [Kribbella sp. CA-293567]